MRRFSTGKQSLPAVNVTRCGKKQNILRITMAAAPVNSLGISLIMELRQAFEVAGKDETCEGIILASDCRVFSAGLNMKELHTTNLEALDYFWSHFQELCYTIYGTKQAVIAEMAGHAPAAGTILALCCDSKVAGPGITVGLNEAAFGLSVPTFVNVLMQDLIGIRQANRAMSLGTLFKSDQALSIGLVDVVAEAEGEVAARALEECELYLNAPGRGANKFWQRKKTLALFRAEQQMDKEAFLQCVLDPLTQMRLGAYLESLSKGKGKK